MLDLVLNTRNALHHMYKVILWLGSREMKYLSQDQTASARWKLGLDLGSLAPEPVLSTIYLSEISSPEKIASTVLLYVHLVFLFSHGHTQRHKQTSSR